MMLYYLIINLKYNIKMSKVSGIDLSKHLSKQFFFVL